MSQPADGEVIDNVEEEGGDSAVDPKLLFTDEAMNSISDGQGILDFVATLPQGRTMYHRGLTMNRTLKEMKTAKLLPAEFEATTSYGSMNANVQRYFELQIKSLSRDRLGETFQGICEAILSKKTHSAIPAASDSVGSVVTNRYALLVHTMIEPRFHQLWVEYNTKIPAGDRPNRLTEGVALVENDIVDRLLEATRLVAETVSNATLKQEHPQLFNTIFPEQGQFADRAQLKKEITTCKNNFDTLWYRLNKSGRNESGDILDSTALHFCKYGGRTVNASHFYQWLLWKGKDLLFLSNRLDEGVGLECGFETVPYALAVNRGRPSSSSQSSSRSISPATTGSSLPPLNPSRSNQRLTYSEDGGDVYSEVGQASVLSKKEQKQLETNRAMATAVGEALGGSLSKLTGIAGMDASSNKRTHEISPEEKEMKRLKDKSVIDLRESQANLVNIEARAKEQAAIASEKQAKLDTLQKAMNDPSFLQLPEEARVRIQSTYVQLLL